MFYLLCIESTDQICVTAVLFLDRNSPLCKVKFPTIGVNFKFSSVAPIIPSLPHMEGSGAYN